MKDAASPPETSPTRAHLVVLKPILPTEVFQTAEIICRDLSVGTRTDGHNIYNDRARIVQLLDQAPQRYLDAVRILTAARTEYERAERTLERVMAECRSDAIRAIQARSKTKSVPQRWVVDDWVHHHRETQIDGPQRALHAAESARKEAEALVRASDPTTREASLRRLLDETR